MKVVLDPVHGYIELDDFVLDLLATSQVQRLRRVRQLGFQALFIQERTILVLNILLGQCTLPLC